MKHVRWVRRTSTVVIPVILAAVLVIAWAYQRDEGSVGPLGHWEPVGAQPQVNELESSGKLMPVMIVEIPSPAAGVITSLEVAVGDEVVRGQQLARIESPELVAQLRMAQATILRQKAQDGAVLAGEEPAEVLNARRRVLTAQSALETAQARQQESSTLFAKGFVSRNEDEAAKGEVKNAEEQLILAQEELKSAVRKFAPDQLKAMKLEAENKRVELTNLQERLGQLTLASPLAGVVLAPQAPDNRGESSRELAVGSRVTADQAVLAIGDTSSFRIRGTCTEADSVWLEEGADAEVSLGALPEQTFTAKVIKVLGLAGSSFSPHYGDQGASCQFVVDFPSPQQPLSDAQRRKIRLGSTAKLKVRQTVAQRQTSIPLAAVLWAHDGAAQVRWRGSASDAPKLVPIRIARSNVAEVQIRETLDGEVWVPGELSQEGTEDSSLKQMLGLED